MTSRASAATCPTASPVTSAPAVGLPRRPRRGLERATFRVPTKVPDHPGKGTAPGGVAAAQARPEVARPRLETGPRQTPRGWLAARRLDAVHPRADALGDRAEFHRAVGAACGRAVLGLTDVDEFWRTEQRATWERLERFGLERCVAGRRPRARTVPTPCRAAEDSVA